MNRAAPRAWALLLNAGVTLALTLALTLSGCGDTTTTTYCTFNSDCPLDADIGFCVNGTCRSAECVEDRDCAEGFTCVQGSCTAGQ